MQRAQLEKHSKNGCLVFRNLGTCCSVHVFAEASVRLRKDCGLRSQPDEPDNSSISKSSNDLAMTLSHLLGVAEVAGSVPLPSSFTFHCRTSLQPEAGTQEQLESGLPQHISQDWFLVGAALWSRIERSNWLDSDLLCPVLCQELVGRELGWEAYQLTGRAWETLAFLPLPWAPVCVFGVACLDLTHRNFRNFVMKAECAVD
ncbi:uncharacterized protein [Phaenicophaeus curvirostris]|uniref:uncharacterized protein isoform X1 n=1 Tax=Phaenicophaeus curvirostris TaxID=33595 RepID=UPI0037F0A5AF